MSNGIILPRHKKLLKEAKRGRPSTGFNKAAYMKEYMRKRRASSKALPSPPK